MVNGGKSGDSESLESSESGRRTSRLLDSDSARDTSMLSLSASETHAKSRSAIVNVATCLGNHQLSAYAKDEGTIEVYDMARNVRHVVAQSPHSLGADHVALLATGNYIAYSMCSIRVAVKQRDLASTPGEIKMTTRWTEKEATCHGTIDQLLIDTTGKCLLVSGREKIQVLNLENGSVIVEKTPEQTGFPHAKWETSTDDPETLLALTGNAVSTFTWNDLNLQQAFPIDRSQGTSDLSPATSLTADHLLPSYHPRTSLLVTSFEERGQKYLTFLLLDTSVLREGPSLSKQTSAPGEAPVIRPVQISPSIALEIQQPVGLLRDGRLIFLDENLWVCTAQVLRVEGGAGRDGSLVKRHFFIPRDWLTSAGTMLCRVQADGTLLCPSKGEMAVIRSDLGSGW